MGKKQQRWFGSRSGEINPVLPFLLLGFALAAVFCYRVATTDPRWNGGDVQLTAEEEVSK